MGYKKRHKGNISEEIFTMREKFREFDDLLKDIQEFFYKTEKKVEKDK